jgi:hypothetical protein
LIKQHVLSGAFGTGFALGLLAKDVGIARDLADQIGADAPVVQLVCGLWADARDTLGGDQDHTRAALHWERRALHPAADNPPAPQKKVGSFPPPTRFLPLEKRPLRR